MRWMNVDDLTAEELRLTKLELEEVVFIRGIAFTIQTITLRPAEVVLAPLLLDKPKPIHPPRTKEKRCPAKKT